jgi:molybdate transport system permease protein
MNWDPIILTFQLASVTTFLLFFIALPLGYWLSQTKNKFKPLIETLISMPLVLPPTVLGFYFLIAFSPGNAFGLWLNEWIGIKLVFSFSGLVIASILYSLPFMVHPIQSGLTNLPPSLHDASTLMGKSKTTTLFKVLLPNCKASLLTGIILSFAHTIGEFGIVLMIGGNIPGETKVASIAIYDEVEALNYTTANVYALILCGSTFLILLFVYLQNGGSLKKHKR